MLRPIILLTCSSLLLPTSIAQDPATDLRTLEQQWSELNDKRSALQQKLEIAKLAVIRADVQRWGLPALAPGEQVIWHPAHALVYSETHEIAKWTVHIVVTDIVQGNLARIDTFLMDSLVPTGSSTVEDYWNSGYDRGHLVASADMRWSKPAMAGTYLYSNVAPQKPELNRGTWADLEDWIRRYVHYGNERAFVLTGPVLRDGLPKMNNPGHKNEVSIPERYWKIVADLDGDDKKAIAFVMTNGVNDHPPISYAVSVDSVERLTGLDFFPALDDITEARIEAMRQPADWYHDGDPFFGEVEPLKAPLAKGLYNTVQAKYHVGKEATICGTVVSTRRTQKANAVYLNLDRMHPNQDFYATVWDVNGPNFSYDPETWLVNKVVCITGVVTLYDDIPRISVNNEHAIQLWDDMVR
ncbi:MAG: DNA/RNA non-specific endonuclease [Flavobacteriales bacterium]|nr:DNA/RNA non-specific endonuclease [Flavobacteriales bacterium]